MNLIGFNRKQDNRLQRSLKMIKPIVKILVPVLMSSLIIVTVLIFPGHKAWVIIEGSPEKIKISDFQGRIDCNASAINLDEISGRIINQQSLYLDINGEGFDLKPGELIIDFKSKENVEDLQMSNIIQFEPDISVNIIDSYINMLEVNSNYLFQRFEDLPENKWVKISGYQDDFRVTANNKLFKMTVQGNVNLYIKNKLFKSAIDYYILNFNFSNNQQIINSFEFLNFHNFKLLVPEKNGELLFTGNGTNVNSFFLDGEIKFNQTSTEKQFTLNKKELDINTIKGDKLDIAYSNSREKNLEAYGYTNEIHLTGNSLFPTFKQFLIENLSTLIQTVIAILLGIIITKKSI